MTFNKKGVFSTSEWTFWQQALFNQGIGNQGMGAAGTCWWPTMCKCVLLHLTLYVLLSSKYYFKDKENNNISIADILKHNKTKQKNRSHRLRFWLVLNSTVGGEKGPYMLPPSYPKLLRLPFMCVNQWARTKSKALGSSQKIRNLSSLISAEPIKK